MGTKSSSQAFNKPKKRPPIPKNDPSSGQADDLDLASEVENTRIKMETLDMNKEILSGNKTVPRDLYEPSFNSQKSVSCISHNNKT